MISASTDFNTRINQDSRTFRARLKKGDGVISGEIKKITICKGACGDNFSVGSVYAPFIEVEISDCSDTLENEEVLLQIGLLLLDGTIEYIDIGYFTVTKPKNTAYQTTFTAVGRISVKLNVLPDIPQQRTISNLAEAITAKTGVPIIFKSLAATGSIEKELKGMTCKELLEVITSVLGGFATEDSRGNIVISKYSTENPISYNGDRVIELPQFNDYDYTLSGIKVVVSEEGEDEDGNVIPEVAFTEGTPRMVLSNPYMTEALFTNFAANTIGYSYRPGTVPIALGDPRLEPWDCLEVTDVKGNTYTVPCLNIVHTFDGGLSTTITAPGDSEAEEESATKGPIMQQLERMSADIFTAREAIVKRIKADEAELLYAKIETVEAEKGRIDNLSGELSAYKQYVGEKFTGVEGNFTKISGDLSTYKEYVGEKFTGIEGDFKTLNAEAVKTNELEAKVGQFGYLKAKDLESEIGKFGYLKAKDLESEVGKFGYLTADTADLRYANIGDFNAVSGRVGTLEGGFADFVSGDFGDLSAGVADIKTLLFGSATGNTITTDFSNAVVSHIGTAQIDSAMIKDLSFDKITGFDVNTTNVTVHSADGKSQWKDNTIQISDADRVRVQIGKDASGDYSMYVWDKSGKLMFDALGLTGSGIQREIIRNDMVAQNAAIDGSKLNIESVFREMNGSTYTLESNHLTYDGKKLDLFLGTMSDTVTGQGNLLSSQGTQITAIQGELDSKIWQQDINTATGEMNTKYSNLAQDLSGFKTTVGSTYATKAENQAVVDKAEAAQSTAAQTADKFNWIVKSGTSATDFTLTDRVARLTAEQINLNGLVTLGGLDNAAQNKINTASSDANAAKTTANNAASTATTAKSTAESAASTASTAKTTAEEAKSTAETAKNTANTASTNASTALSTANAAKLATEVETISGNLKKFKNVCGYTVDASNLKGALIITTPITPSRMVSVHIKGYNYVGGQETIDMTVGFYNYTNSMAQVGYINNGSMALTPVKVAKVSSSDTRAVIIIGDATTIWQYPKIIVDEVITGYSTVCPDSYKDGFSATITATIPTTYAHVTTLSGTDIKTLLNSVKSVADANGKLLTSWCAANDKTLINGDKIFTGSIGADKISVNSLEAICAKIGGFTIGKTYLANNSTALGTIVAGKTDSVYVGVDGVSTNQIITNEYGTFEQVARLFNGTLELSTINSETDAVVDSSLLCGGTLGLADGSGRTLFISASSAEMINAGAVAGGTAYAVDIPTLYLYSSFTVNGEFKIYDTDAGELFRPYYRAGDVINISINTAGYITSGSSSLRFFVPLSKPIIGSPAVTAASVNGFTLRQRNSSTGGSYTHGSASDKTVKPSSYSASIAEDGNGVKISATFSSVANAVNNSPIGIAWSGKITFS